MAPSFKQVSYAPGQIKMINIKDIAKECAVNPATVSRALNGKKGVSEKMRQRIIAVAQEKGYTKNPLAASLITHKSGIIGVVVPDITNPYYASVVQGVNAFLRAQGFSTLLCDSQRDSEQEKNYFSMLCGYRVEGVILLSVTARADDLTIFFQNGIRVVCVDNSVSSAVSSIVNDNYQGAFDLTEHLVQNCDIKKLVALMGSPQAETTRQRQRGCSEALQKLRKMHILTRIFYIDAEYEKAYRIMDEIMDEEPDCLFCVNDVVALGAFSYCMNNGIRVPEDLKIAGFDDIAASSMISVPLTTVHQRKFVLGQRAAEQLLKELSDVSTLPTRIELLPRLVVRASCGEKIPKKRLRRKR